MEWTPIKKKPPTSGYYLATWAIDGDHRRLRVSELWFDGSIWWGYQPYITVDEFYMPTTIEIVIAWMPKPNAYTGENK